jgi:hypothetical protein
MIQDIAIYTLDTKADDKGKKFLLFRDEVTRKN